MTRKRNKNSHTKTPLPALQHQARKTSPAAQIVANRIASGYEEDKSVYDSVVDALKAEGVDDIDILTILEHPDKLEQIGQKLFGAQPDLRQRAEK